MNDFCYLFNLLQRNYKNNWKLYFSTDIVDFYSHKFTYTYTHCKKNFFFPFLRSPVCYFFILNLIRKSTKMYIFLLLLKCQIKIKWKK